MVESEWKAPAPPLEIGKDAVAPFTVQRVEPLFEKAVEIHWPSRSLSLGRIAYRRGCAMARCVAPAVSAIT
jgi:hypothetical protein